MPDETSSSVERELGSSRPSSESEAPGKKDKPCLQPLHFTSQQQDDIVLWFQEHGFLYDKDKDHADYKLTVKKIALWREKAEELGVCDG